ncbi:Hsp20 family protein [Roseococcus sp. SYP-B2431]|uniref:Hsp20 family protein n=1 Tax=Roseococcus sp. SYP-B2431 TaxID=2496640 RepID=UPI00103D3086|nr:Hsp20 family protein [Roseococcus sp. SYP-B2431]TCI00791.1 Hsp20 family protein [Roseococcus sp. SYP-B2431]
MRALDFAPLYRSTVGFDRLFERLENSVRSEWPPYDIERLDDNAYRISMAVAGFLPEDLELTQQGGVLVVTGKKEAENGQRSGMLHQGLAFRSFRQSFNLADHLKVTRANLVNGMLTIDLVREIPEALQPRRIAIGTSPGAEHSGEVVASLGTQTAAQAA